MKFDIPGHRKAYRAFSKWLGAKAAGPDMTPENILAFEQNYKGVAQTTLRSYCCGMRVIARQFGHTFPCDEPRAKKPKKTEKGFKITAAWYLALPEHHRKAVSAFAKWLNNPDLTPEDLTEGRINDFERVISDLQPSIWNQRVASLRAVSPHFEDRFKVTAAWYPGLSTHHRKAVSAFARWLNKPDIQPEDITEERIKDFEKVIIKLQPSLWTQRLAALRILSPHIENGNKRERLPQHVMEHEGKPTLWSIFTTQYAPRKLLGKSPRTTILYGIALKKFSYWLGHPAMLSDLSDEVVAAFLQSELDAGAAVATVHKEGSHIQALWRYAARKRLVEEFPEMRLPEPPDTVPDAYTLDEIKRLIATCRAQTGTISDIPAGVWWELLLRVIFDTGERITAVMKIKRDNINPGGWLIVPAATRKGQTKGKHFKLSARSMELVQLAKSSSELLLPWDKNPNYVWKQYEKILVEAGLPYGRRAKFHKLRRSVATHYEAAGGNATELLGHSSRKVTEAYIDVSFTQTVQPCDLLSLGD